MQTLSPRLKMAADMVRDGVVVADIGTDHAYLSSYLVITGKCPRALSSDLRAGPLENAAATLRAFSLDDKITLRLSDGLDKISPDEADDFVFAGMGGELITDILERTPWIKDSSKRFIFQPMTHAEILRSFLIKNGFRILTETACFDECRPYIAICAEYSPGFSDSFGKSYIYLGELVKNLNEASSYYFTKQYIYLKKRADALESANLLPEEVASIREILPDIEPYIRKKN